MSDKLKVRFLVFFGKYGTKSRISFYYNDLIFTLFLNKPHSRYKQKREVKSTSLSFSVDNSALFQHSDTFDMMCLGKHINRNPKNSNRWISDNDEIINKSNKNTSLFWEKRKTRSKPSLLFYPSLSNSPLSRSLFKW